MFGNANIQIRKCPSLTGIEIDDQTLAFIQSWSVMVDWQRYKSLVFVDLGFVYFMVFNLADEEMVDCYLGEYQDDLWYMEVNRQKTWERINNIVEIIPTKQDMQLGGQDGLPGNEE